MRPSVVGYQVGSAICYMCEVVCRYRISVTTDYSHRVNVDETMWPVFAHAVLRLVVEFHEAFSEVGQRLSSGVSCEAGQWHSWEIWLYMPASKIGYELSGWPMVFLRKLATCARKEKWLWAMWLFTLCNLYSALGTLHCVLCTLYSVLCTLWLCTLCTRCTLYSVHSVLLYSVYSALCTLYSVLCVLCTM